MADAPARSGGDGLRNRPGRIAVRKAQHDDVGEPSQLTDIGDERSAVGVPL